MANAPGRAGRALNVVVTLMVPVALLAAGAAVLITTAVDDEPRLRPLGVILLGVGVTYIVAGAVLYRLHRRRQGADRRPA